VAGEREVGNGFVFAGGAEGEVGLQGFDFLERAGEGAFVLVDVAVGGGGLLFIEGVQRGGEEAAGDAGVPTGVDELFEELELQFADGADFLIEGRVEALELGNEVFGEEERGGTEAVRAGVLTGACLAFGGAGAGAVLRVFAVGVVLGWR